MPTVAMTATSSGSSSRSAALSRSSRPTTTATRRPIKTVAVFARTAGAGSSSAPSPG